MNINFKKINTLNALAIICMALVVVVGGLYYFSEKNINKNNEDTDTEVQKNIELNKDAISKANKMNIKKVRAIDDNDHIRGALTAPAQLIVYSDFECPFCYKFADILKKVEETFNDKIVIAFRHYPLLSHENAIPAAIASECASEQDKFWEMHDKLFQDAKEDNLNLEAYKEDAKELGLDLTQFNKCLDTKKYKDAIALSQLEAKEFGVNGTPANFINGDPVPGAVPFEDFVDSSGESRKGMKSLIEEKLRKETN